jgi:hypothetical protein
MKDIVISGRQIARELAIFAACIVAALCLNAYSIMRFNTQWKELFTTFHFTLAIALILFVLLALFRAVVFCCLRLFRRKAA